MGFGGAIGGFFGDVGTGATDSYKGDERKIDESRFEYEGESAEEKERKARAAAQRKAPKMTAADVGNVALGGVQPATMTQVGGVDPVTGLAVRDVGQANAAQVAPGQQEFRDAQSALVAGLQEQIAGTGPSVAQLQLQQARDENVARTLAAAASARGEVSPALIERAAMEQIAETGRQAGRDAAMLRAEETAQARGQLSDVLGTARQQDVGLGLGQAELEQQAELANLDARIQTALAQGDMDTASALQNQRVASEIVQQQAGLDVQTKLANLANQREMALAQGNIDLAIALERARLDQDARARNLDSALEQRAMNDQLVQFYEAQGMATDMAQLQAQMDLERLITEQHIAIEQTNAGLAGPGLGLATGIVGGMAQGAGAAAAVMSDERAKTDITHAGDDELGRALLAAAGENSGGPIETFMDGLEPFRFRYKDPELPGAGPGEYLGIMAQDAEQTELGRLLVEETEHGKALDVGRGLSLSLAGLANIHQRLREIESGRG